MVSVLFAVSRIAADRLKVAFLDLTNPDICPGRWDSKRANPREGFLSADQPSIRAKVSKCFACPDATNARHAVGHVSQPGDFGRSDRVCGSESHINWNGTSKTSVRRSSK